MLEPSNHIREEGMLSTLKEVQENSLKSHVFFFILSIYRLKNAPYVGTLQSYKGGGYVVNFERSFRRTARNLTRLRQENWLDLRTRAIFLEFTVYNPNSNLYASAIMLTEFPSYGAAVARTEFKVSFSINP